MFILRAYSRIALGSAEVLTALNLINSAVLVSHSDNVYEGVILGSFLGAFSVAKGVILGAAWPLCITDIAHRKFIQKDEWGPLLVTNDRKSIRPEHILIGYTLPLYTVLSR